MCVHCAAAACACFPSTTCSFDNARGERELSSVLCALHVCVWCRYAFHCIGLRRSLFLFLFVCATLEFFVQNPSLDSNYTRAFVALPVYVCECVWVRRMRSGGRSLISWSCHWWWWLLEEQDMRGGKKKKKKTLAFEAHTQTLRDWSLMMATQQQQPSFALTSIGRSTSGVEWARDKSLSALSLSWRPLDWRRSNAAFKLAWNGRN